MTISTNSPGRATSFADLSSSSAPPRAAKKSLDSADFMKLLSVQFQRQDPLKPMEDTAFIAQMAQFSALEQSNSLVAEMGRLRADQQLLTANSYLGRTVTVDLGQGETATGVVSAVESGKSGVTLTVGGESYALAAVRRIEPTSPAPQEVDNPAA
jgi:flagellar basal-body rod modification protein FlgD